jgi:nitroimidazol reductase NimA-like FMN-containing flavoprotein (pyridoxamine 5'-phosphate oxidase superfamily)
MSGKVWKEGTMRRADREIPDIAEKLSILGKSKVFRLAMTQDDQPYVVPLNFGFEYTEGRLFLYFHCAQDGQKVDMLEKNNRVCFEVDGEHRLIAGEAACNYGFSYESVIGFGEAELLETNDEKIHALNVLMKHQTDQDRDFDFGEAQLNAVRVYRINVASFSAKRRQG